MVSCADFLRDFSDYRDGLMSSDEHTAVEAHLHGCSACARYARIVESGVGALRSLPEIEPSYDFLPRLQHRIYHLEDERSGGWRRGASGVSAGFLVMVVVLLAAVGTLPLGRTATPVIELPPVVAAAPKKTEPVHALFRAGPLLGPASSPSAALARPANNALFFRYSPLGSYVSYSGEALRPR